MRALGSAPLSAAIRLNSRAEFIGWPGREALAKLNAEIVYIRRNRFARRREPFTLYRDFGVRAEGERAENKCNVRTRSARLLRRSSYYYLILNWVYSIFNTAVDKQTLKRQLPLGAERMRALASAEVARKGRRPVRRL